MVLWAQTLLATELLYALLIPLTKTIILLLYLRLFNINRWFRFATYGLLGYIWMWGAALILTSIFECSPISYQWDKTIEGRCIDQLAYFRWICVPNAIHDVAILLIPAPVVWKLKIDMRRKMALLCVFFLGSV